MGEGTGDDEAAELAASIGFWWGIVPPNAAANAFMRDVLAIPAAFKRLPPVPFEAEPAEFAVVLEAFADRDEVGAFADQDDQEAFTAPEASA